MIKGILFDKDGTLIEFKSTWHQIMTLVFKRLENENVEALMEISGYNREGFEPESIIQYLSTRDIIELWMNVIMHHSQEEMLDIFEDCATDQSIEVELLDYVKEGLDYLFDKGYVLGIATADTKESAYYSLEKSGIKDYFSFIGSDDGKTQPKPHKEMAKRFAEKNDIKLDEIIIVGDSINDYKFSEVVKCDFVGIRAEYNNLSDLNVTLVNNLKEMIELKCL